MLPQTLKIDLTADMSNDVRLMVTDLENNILSGLILVLAVIFLFIGGQSAIFVALAIPYSMFITFSLLTGFNVTLNMVALFSLSRPRGGAGGLKRRSRLGSSWSATKLR